MKKVVAGMCLAMLISPAFSVETSIQGYEATKYFNNPNDARFKYELPANNPLSFKKDTKSESVDDESDITLDEADIKPVKKVIKKLEDGVTPTVNQKDVPMNYDSFPKFYNNNDMIQQQFMPMF